MNRINTIWLLKKLNYCLNDFTVFGKYNLEKLDMNKNFIKNGYIVLRNVFPLKLHKEMQALVLNILSKKYKSNNYQEFCSQIKNKKIIYLS